MLEKAPTIIYIKTLTALTDGHHLQKQKSNHVSYAMKYPIFNTKKKAPKNG
jgi:hypothetical protein